MVPVQKYMIWSSKKERKGKKTSKKERTRFSLSLSLRILFSLSVSLSSLQPCLRYSVAPPGPAVPP